MHQLEGIPFYSDDYRSELSVSWAIIAFSEISLDGNNKGEDDLGIAI